MRPTESYPRLFTPRAFAGSLALSGLVLFTAGACTSKPASDHGGEAKSAPAKAASAPSAPASAPAGDAFKPLSKEEGMALLAEEESALQLPSPSDLLKAISNLEAGGETVKLDSYIGKAPKGSNDDVESQAFVAGTLITDFLIYAQAEDKEACQSTAKALRATVKALDLEDKFDAPGKELEAALAKGDWGAVSRKMDEIFETFKDTRDDSKDSEKVAAILTASAWMESIYVLSQHLDANYSEPASKLLRQGFIGESLRDELGKFSSSGFAEKLQPVMVTLVEATTVDREAPVSKEAVAKISSAIKGLRATLEG
ncbi:MAG: hypothetical protein AAFZ18_25240 [Myxococcota bacterium]